MTVYYDYFCDAMCVNTTYRKNKGPFAIFVMLHVLTQLIEKINDGVFVTFVKAMSGKTPKTIFKDQDVAMGKVISFQCPKTCHRLCICHIYQNAASTLVTFLISTLIFLMITVVVCMILMTN